MKDLKLNYKKTIYIGLAFMLITMFWQTYDNIIAKILIDKFGLKQSTSGIVMALDNVLAIFMLPLFGLLSDKTKSKLGKRTPFIIVGVLIASIAYVSLSFVDHRQTVLVNEAGIVEEYKDIYEKETISIEEWDITFDKIKETHPEIYNDYQKIRGSNDERERYDVFYNYLSARAWELTKNDTKNLIGFIILLLITLIAMSTFRSPAVALMPDVTPKPLRSKANAIINLMGSAGAVIALLILQLTNTAKESYVPYSPVFISVGVIMILLLIVFLIKVKENDLLKENQQLIKQYGLEDEEDAPGVPHKLTKPEIISLVLILFSVFFWYMGYNAVISKLSDYAPKILNMGVTLPLFIAQGAAIIAFIPIGILSSKFGRKKMILVGVIMLTLCFGGAYFLTPNTGWILYILLAFTGIAWATINVNSFPMAVELATGNDVGKFTGYYYAFSMAAQIITPILSGILMDISRLYLFPYAAIMVAVSFFTMLFVKHGDVKVERKGILESCDVED